MSQRKNRPVMYEVISQARGAREAAAQRRAPLVGGGASPPAASGAAAGAVSGAADAIVAPVAASAASPAVRMSGGKIVLRLGWPELTVAGVLLASLLGGAFYAGYSARSAAQRSEDSKVNTLSGDFSREPAPAAHPPGESAPLRPRDSRESRSAAPPKPDVNPKGGDAGVALPPKKGDDGSRKPDAGADGAGESAKGGAPDAADGANAASEKHVFQEGYHYLVIQYFPKSRSAAARQAADFLTGKGVAVVVVRRGEDYCLVATEPFLIDDRTQTGKQERTRCEALKKTILEAGKEYQKTGGYDFKGCAPQRM